VEKANILSIGEGRLHTGFLREALERLGLSQ